MSEIDVLIKARCGWSDLMAPITKLARVFLLCAYGKNQRANNADDPCRDKRHLRRDLPKQTTNGGGWRDRQTADKIIKPNRARAYLLFRKVNNHGFPRRLANLAQAAYDKSDNQKRETGSPHHGDRKKRKAQEGSNDERLAPDAIGNLAR